MHSLICAANNEVEVESSFPLKMHSVLSWILSMDRCLHIPNHRSLQPYIVLFSACLAPDFLFGLDTSTQLGFSKTHSLFSERKSTRKLYEMLILLKGKNPIRQNTN